VRRGEARWWSGILCGDMSSCLQAHLRIRSSGGRPACWPHPSFANQTNRSASRRCHFLPPFPSPTPALQVSVVGDFDPAELEACALKYLGTVSPEPKVELPAESATMLGAPLQIRSGMPLQERHMVWHLKDSGELPAGPALPTRLPRHLPARYACLLSASLGQ
jgi:hypothetical protein